MADYSPRPDEGPGDRAPRQSIRIYLKHHTNPTLAPRTVTCEDYERKATKTRPAWTEKGCGVKVIRYATYPNQKGIRFDSDPEVVPGTETNMGDGSIVASVYTENVHFSTCPARKPAERPTTGVPDGRHQFAGE